MFLPEDLTPLFQGEPMRLEDRKWSESGYAFMLFSRWDEYDPNGYWLVPDSQLVAKLMPWRVNLSHGPSEAPF